VGRDFECGVDCEFDDRRLEPLAEDAIQLSGLSFAARSDSVVCRRNGVLTQHRSHEIEMDTHDYKADDFGGGRRNRSDEVKA
jgi:hypothetical protein